MRVLIIGCGYLGRRIAQRLSARGDEVFAVSRSAGPESVSWKAVQADITIPEHLARMEPAFDVVVNSVSSSRGGVAEYEAVYREGTQNVLRWLHTAPPKRYFYTSSTSVYGQTDGSWVNETSRTQPASETSQVLVATEQLLLEAHDSSGFPAVVLRLAGIYGPGRGRLFQQYVRGEAVLVEDGENWINMIHVDDAAAAVVHLLDRSAPGEIYNLVDDKPVTQLEFLSWLSQELKRPLPPSGPRNPNRKRGLTNKRVSNATLRRAAYAFLYPTYREGYAQAVAEIPR